MGFNKIKNILFFVLYFLLNPRLVYPLMRGVYLPVYIQFFWLKRYKIDTFIDIGSYKGDVARAIHYIFPNSTIYVFEPIKDLCNNLKRKLGSKNIFINNVALSDKEGEATLFRYDNSALSSILPISKTALLYKNNRLARKSKVKTATLDSYFNGRKLTGVIFVKIDTQGTEGLILQGGEETLKKVSIIHIETSFEELYKGQMLFDDIYKLLASLGFKYTGESRESYFYPKFTFDSQVNSVFINEKLIDFIKGE